MGLENRTTIAQHEGEREDTSPLNPPAATGRPDAAPGRWDTSSSRPHSGGCSEPARRAQRDHARAAQWRWRVGEAEIPSQSTDRGRGGEARVACRGEEPRRRRCTPAEVDRIAQRVSERGGHVPPPLPMATGRHGEGPEGRDMSPSRLSAKVAASRRRPVLRAQRDHVHAAQ